MWLLDFIQKSAKNLGEIKAEAKNQVLCEILFKSEGVFNMQLLFMYEQVRSTSVRFVSNAVTRKSCPKVIFNWEDA